MGYDTTKEYIDNLCQIVLGYYPNWDEYDVIIDMKDLIALINASREDRAKAADKEAGRV